MLKSQGGPFRVRDRSRFIDAKEAKSGDPCRFGIFEAAKPPSGKRDLFGPAARRKISHYVFQHTEPSIIRLITKFDQVLGD